MLNFMEVCQEYPTLWKTDVSDFLAMFGEKRHKSYHYGNQHREKEKEEDHYDQLYEKRKALEKEQLMEMMLDREERWSHANYDTRIYSTL